jgi:putative hydrolase of the HAD superfamily
MVAFDLDDTLWENGDVLRTAVAGVEAQIDRQHPSMGDSRENLPEIVDEIRAKQPHLAHDFRLLREAVLTKRACDAGLEPKTVVPDLMARFAALRNRVSPYDGVPELLANLVASGLRVAAVTNGTCDVSTVPGVAEHMEFAVSPDTCGAAKPAPEIFDALAARAGLRHDQIFVVGDDWTADATGAFGAGMHGAWIHRGKPLPASVELIDGETEPFPDSPASPWDQGPAIVRINHVLDIGALLGLEKSK